MTSHKPVCKAGMRLWSCTDLSKQVTLHRTTIRQHSTDTYEKLAHIHVYDSGKFVCSLTMLQDRLTKKQYGHENGHIYSARRCLILSLSIGIRREAYTSQRKPIWDPTPTSRLIFPFYDFMRHHGLLTGFCKKNPLR